MTSDSSRSKADSTSNKPAPVSSKSNAPLQPNPARKSTKRPSTLLPTESADNFYRAFEERHRGSRDLIKNRLNIYLPFIEPLKQIYPQCAAIDLGCGRGEWLELLQETGFAAHGVDLDEGMLAACRERGLPATRQDAIEHIKSLDENSQSIVSGFHFAEHIPFTNLQLLIAEASRVLKPGGLLILETPNPENVAVGTTNFYLDPTHQRPIPPLLLSFLAEYQGFKRVKILRLQEPPDLAIQEGIELKNVFFGVSPDYAIVAQKSAGSEILLRFTTAFDKNYGIRLEDLANRYDATIERRVIMLDQRIGNVESSAGGIVDALSRIGTLQDRLIDATAHIERSQFRAADQEQRAVAAEARAADQEQRAVAAEARAADQEQRAADQEQRADLAEARAQQAEARGHQTEAALAQSSQELQALHQANHYHWQLAEERNQYIQALLNSISWRITAPLRSMGRVVIRLRGHAAMPQSTPGVVQSTLRRTAASVLNWGVSYAQKTPRFRRVVLTVLNRMPGLAIKLRQMHIQSQLAPHPHHGDWSSNQTPMPAGQTSPHSGSDANRPPSIPLSDGINARQRTPLEAYFHACGGNE